MILTVTTTTVRPSTCCDTASALDAYVIVTYLGTEYSGEVTLLPAEDNRYGYGSWGSPCHWVSDGLLHDLEATGDLEEILHVLAREAGVACDEWIENGGAQ